jgi:carbon monoxide dehydrogenase subunit G
MKVERAVTVDRTGGEVFAFLSNLENHVRFVPGLVEFSLTTPLGPDAQAVAVRRAFGRLRRLPYRITTFIPGQAIGVGAQLGPLIGTAEYRVEAIEGGRARVIMTSEYQGRGPFGLLDRLLAWMARPDTAAVTSNLKRVLDTGPA